VLVAVLASGRERGLVFIRDGACFGESIFGSSKPVFESGALWRIVGHFGKERHKRVAMPGFAFYGLHEGRRNWE
jgi:hypothetical protein